MKSSKGGDFWKRNVTKLSAAVAICISLDLFSSLGSVFFIAGIEKIVAGANAGIKCVLS